MVLPGMAWYSMVWYGLYVFTAYTAYTAYTGYTLLYIYTQCIDRHVY